MSIYFWYSAVLYTSQDLGLEVVNNAENGIFSSSLMSFFSPNVGQQKI